MTSIQYCKRYRMELDLEWIDPVPALPGGFRWTPWTSDSLPIHAEVKWRSFQGELDSIVFPNLAHREGCVHLMRLIQDMPGFMPESTWLIDGPQESCGTIQGIREQPGWGMIQNIGVLPNFRGLGLGRALLLQALHGFRNAGLRYAYLEVSASNRRAVRLYHQTGFTIRKKFYREFTRAMEEIYSI